MSKNKNEPMNNNRIKEVRLSKHKTQKDLSKLLGVSEQAIAYYEKALREPPLRSWIKLANYLGVSVSYLQGISDYPTEESFKEHEFIRDFTVHDPEKVTFEDVKKLYEEIEKSEKTQAIFTGDVNLKKYVSLANSILNNINSKTEKDFYLKWEKQIKKRQAFVEFPRLIQHIFRMFIFSSSAYDETSQKYYKELKKLVSKYDKEEKSYFDL